MNYQIRKEHSNNGNDFEDLDFIDKDTEKQEVSTLLAPNPDKVNNNKETKDKLNADKGRDITNLVNLMDVTDWSPPNNCSPSFDNQISFEDDISQQERSTHNQSTCDIMDNTTFTFQSIREEEMLFTCVGKHDTQACAMREFCKEKTNIACSCEERNFP